MQPQKRELIPIAALKNNLPVLHMKKAAAAQARRISPLQNGPFGVLKDIFGNAVHLRGNKVYAMRALGIIPGVLGVGAWGTQDNKM